MKLDIQLNNGMNKRKLQKPGSLTILGLMKCYNHINKKPNTWRQTAIVNLLRSAMVISYCTWIYPFPREPHNKYGSCYFDNTTE